MIDDKNKTNIELNSDIEKYFLDACHDVSCKQGIQMSESLTQYLASMLRRFVSSANFFEPETDPYTKKTKNAIPAVGTKLLEANALGSFEQLVEMQQVGDLSLFTSGFFNKTLDRRMLDMDFYSAIGGQAYQRAGQIRNSISKEQALNVYFELSEKFLGLSEILSELSDQRYLNSQKDQLRLYEKWLSTGNPRIQRMLREVGIMSSSQRSES